MGAKSQPISPPFGHKAGLPPSKKYLLVRQPPMATKRFLRFFLSFITTKQVFCRHYDSVDLCWIVRFLLHYAQLYPYAVRIILCIYHNISPYFAKTSGKHIQKRISVVDGSLTTTFISFPR